MLDSLYFSFALNTGSWVCTDHAPCAVICRPTILHSVSSLHCLSELSGLDRSRRRGRGHWLEQTKSSRTAPAITSWAWERAWREQQSKQKKKTIVKWVIAADSDPCSDSFVTVRCCWTAYSRLIHTILPLDISMNLKEDNKITLIIKFHGSFEFHLSLAALRLVS